MTLEDSELVVDNIKFFSRNDTFLKQVHQIFYNRACKANEVKANLIAFSGLPDYYQVRALPVLVCAVRVVSCRVRR